MNLPASGVILVADHDIEASAYLETALVSHGFSVHLLEDSEELLAYLGARRDGPVSAIVLDALVPGRGGLETLGAIRQRQTSIPIVFMLSPWVSVQAEEPRDIWTRCVEKPVSHDELARVLHEMLQRSSAEIPIPVASGPKPPSLIAQSRQMRLIESSLQPLAWFDVPVLLAGETGVGKEVLARRIHMLSQRAGKPFVKLNCAALPKELVESELFGYERGAFTGAERRRPGMFETAESGTIFLDEIGDMDLSLQAKLLQVLQDGEFYRLGGNDVAKVDVRVMAATHRDLMAAVKRGEFREDLYYRLNVVHIQIPPLRERQEEIIPLAEHFLKKHCDGVAIPMLPPLLKSALLRYDWPGNVRELENVMRRYLVLRNPISLAQELVPLSGYSGPPQTVPIAVPCSPATSADLLDKTVFHRVTEANKAEEVAAIRTALDRAQWNRKRAAELLNVDYKALLYKMKKLQIVGATRNRRRARRAAVPA